MRALSLLGILVSIAGMALAGTITTSASCSIDGQPTIAGLSTCSSAETSMRATADAQSNVGFGLSSNALLVSLTQDINVVSDGAPTLPGVFAMSQARASGSLHLELQTSGSGTGLFHVSTLGVASVDSAGEDDDTFSYSLLGTQLSCDVGSSPQIGGCGFSSAGLAFSLGSIFDVDVSQIAEGYADSGDNPWSNVTGTTILKFSFTDASGNPLEISEADPPDPPAVVPEPASVWLALAGLLLFVADLRFRKNRLPKISED